MLSTYKLGKVISLVKSRLQNFNNNYSDSNVISEYLILSLGELHEILGIKDSLDYMTVYSFTYNPAARPEIDLSTYQYCKNIDRMKQIISSSYIFKYIEDPEEFNKLSFEQNNYFLRDKILWTYYNNYIYFYTSLTIQSSFSAKLLFYRTPIIPTSNESYLDIKDGNVNQLIDMTAVKVLQFLKEPIPQELMSAIPRAEKTKNAKIEEKIISNNPKKLNQN